MSFEQKVTKTGRISTLAFCLLSFLPALMLWLVHGVIPPVKTILAGWAGIASIYGVFYVVEPIQYYPVIGLSGNYMSFMAGNIPTVRLPAMMAAQKVVGVEPGTDKGEVISTLAIAASVVVNAAIFFLAAVSGQAILSILPEFVIKSFDNVLAALLGAVSASYVFRNPSLLAVTMLGGYVILMTGLPNWCQTPLSIVVGIAYAVLQYNNKKKKAAAKAE